MLSIQHKLVLVSGLLVALGACKKQSTKPAIIGAKLDAKTMLNVSYGSSAMQKADVYLPANRSENTPVLFLVHGGIFYAGDKADFTAYVQKFTDNGYAVINTNYRLVDSTGIIANPPLRKTSSITIPQQVEDVSSIIAYTAQNAPSWNIGTSKFFIAGHSAGGTLALLQAYLSNDVRIKAVANWAGVTDLSFADESYALLIGPNLAELANRITGYPIKNENKMQYMAVSPYWVLNRVLSRSITEKPTINILPDNNNTLPGLADGSKLQYDALTALLNQKNISNKFVLIPNADHSFGKPGNRDAVISETLNFFASF